MNIIFATGNEGKMNEVRMLLSELNCEIQSLKDRKIETKIEENGSTFEENAMIKAKTVMDWTKEIVLADDSGLEIDYLEKAPGVYSARFLGENTSYEKKNQYIIDKLKGVPENKRSARFVCAIACAFPDGRNFITRGVIEGRIGYEPKGENGFGYDPIFYVPEFDCTTAQLSLEQKNKISHRGKALEKMKTLLLEQLR